MPLAQGWFLRGLVAGVLALGLLWLAAAAHLRQACVVLDTPYLPICDDTAPANRTPDETRARILRNPGDSTAWSRLLVLQGASAQDALLDAAGRVAPNNVNVLRWRAARALERGATAEGIALLVQLVRHRNSGEAATILAQIVATGQALPLLRPHLPTARQWLPPVLGAMGPLKLASGHALPLVAEAIEKGQLSDDARRAYMRSLKAGGQWFDAYGLWLAHHKKEVPLLYNGSFDAALEPDGFDWEVPAVVRSRAGVLVGQPVVARRGHILELEFLGRAFPVPLAAQHVFVPPGKYRLRGEYMASKLRSEGGLLWSVRCTRGQQEVLAKSPPLADTGGVWKPFELAFTIPDDCGAVARIQLDPAAGFEAAAGMKGTVGFDNFSLVRVPS